MRTASVVMIFLFAGSMFAQSPSYKQAETCPVDFAANVSGRAIARSVSDAGKGGGQLLEINFHPLRSADIVGATIAVHGMASGKRLLPVKDGAEESDVQIFQLSKSSGERRLFQSEVWVTKVAAVEWSEITELRYADGSVWQALKDSPCRARPSLLKLVNATAQ
jgi:hypothetical protein